MRDIVEYFTYLTGLIPTPDQESCLRALINVDIKKVLITAGRQTGKTLCCAVAILWWVFEYNIPVKVLLVSAQESVLYFHLREIFKNHPEFKDKILHEGVYSLVPLHGFETTTGSMVYVRGSTDKQIRGLPADIVFIDEACEVKDDIILTGMGNLSGNISKFVCLSTPHVATSIFVKWATDEDGGFDVHQWSGENCAWHDPTIEKTKKKEFTKEKYAVEVLGRPPTESERAFFPLKQVDKCIMEVDLAREGIGLLSRIEIGIDWGYEYAPTVLLVTERIGTTKRKVLFGKAWEKKTMEQMSPDILEIIKKFKPYLVKADSKPPEYKAYFSKVAKGKIQFIDGSLGHKEQMYGQLQRRVRQTQLIIPVKFVELVKQMKKYRKAAGRDDDWVDALALSCYEPTEALDTGQHGRVYFP